MALVRWTFTDAVTFDSYVFELNPNDGGTPALKKNFTYASSLAPEGTALVFEGAREIPTETVTGIIRSKEALDAFKTWFHKSSPIIMEDDLGRQFTIMITEFVPKRKRASSAPWKHDYTLTYLIFEEVS